MSILDEILANKRDEVDTRRGARPLREIERAANAAPPPRDFAAALAGAGLSIIAEIKRSSPAKGDLNPDMDAASMASRYALAGAAAISVLTDQRYFRGSDADLRTVRQVVEVPLLRKDFVVDEYQIYEARVLGADAVLLIVAALTDDEIVRFQDVARALGLSALVEVHDEHELDRALTVGSSIIGINNRNLKTMQVDLATTEKLRPRVPPTVLVVGESGVRNARDAQRLRTAGVDAILVGEALVTAPDASILLREMRSPLLSTAPS